MTIARASEQTHIRPDLDAIVSVIEPKSSVLDLGCGDGELLARLVGEKNINARGVELDEKNVRACVGKGLSVRQGNIEEGLADYRDKAFDFVVLSQTLAFLKRPQPVVREMLRVGDCAVISFENAGYWKSRLRFLGGHGFGASLCSDEDRERAITLDHFAEFARCADAKIVRALYSTDNRRVVSSPLWFAQHAVYVVKVALGS
jgi:methionine biosynthesis protein MetW